MVLVNGGVHIRAEKLSFYFSCWSLANAAEEILLVVTGDVLLELIDALRHQWRLFERKTFRLTPT